MNLPGTRSAALGLLVFLGWVGCAGAPKEEPTPAIFYPPPPAEPRLQLLATFSASDDLKQVSGFRRFVVGEDDRIAVQRAHGVAWHAGRLYVCDPGGSHVFVFDVAASDVRLLDAANRGMFRKPIEIAVAPDGWKYVTDTGHRRVIVYDDQDRYQRAYGEPDRWRPVGIAATTDLLYVTDLANHCLVVLDRRTGSEVCRIGAKGREEGKFYNPLSVAIGPGGDLYVSDSFNFRIQRLRPDGTFVRSYGSIGRSPGQFARPRGVAVDAEGRIYAVDAAFENVQIFDNEGRLLLFFGGPGAQRGALNLPASVRIAYDAVAAFQDKVAPGRSIDYVFFVTSQTGPNKVNVYGLLGGGR